MTRQVHISSLVVRVRSERAADLGRHIESRHNAEVHLGEQHHKIVVVLETDTQGDIARIMSELDTLPGVLGSSLVYHHCETEDALNEELG